MILNRLQLRAAMMTVANNDLHNALLEDRCEVASEKEHNRAEHSGEKSGKGHEGSKVGYSWFADKLGGCLVNALDEVGCNSNATQPMR